MSNYKSIFDLKKQEQEESEKYGNTPREIVSMHQRTIEEVREFNRTVREVESQNSQIEFDDYIEIWLPVHLGFEKEDDQNRYHEEWVKFAGGYHRRVDIFKNGKKILTVPPFFPDNYYKLSSMEGDTIEKGEQSFSTKLDMINQMSENYKTIGENHRADLFDSMLGNIDEKAIEAHKKEWREFFGKLGLLDPKNYLPYVDLPEEEKQKILEKSNPDSQEINQSQENIGNIFIFED